MFFDETRAALLTLLSQPVAVAGAVLLAGLNAAIWLLVFRRAGFPTVLASLLLVPPLTFALPLYFALTRWPGHVRLVRLPTRPWVARARSARRVVPTRALERPDWDVFDLHRPLVLAADGLPRYRIPLPPTSSSMNFLVDGFGLPHS